MKNPFPAVYYGVRRVQPPIPQLGAGVLVIGATHLARRAAQHLLHDRGVAVDLFGGAVDVDEHDRVDVERIAGVGELSAGRRCRAVKPFHRGGHGPGRMIAEMVSAASCAVAKLPIRLRVTGAIGRSATVASVTIASVPSDPISTPSKSGPSSAA